MPSGAYTVLRCDVIHTVGSPTIKIWGRDFHLQRLEQSFRALLTIDDDKKGSENINATTSEAIQQSDRVIQALISCYEQQLPSEIANSSRLLCDSYMLTLLWIQDDAALHVRGHITPYQTAWDPKEYNPSSWKSVLAHDPTLTLPSRKEHCPEAKLSSWCHLRKPLEMHFKVPHAADEVFLLDYKSRATKSRDLNKTLELSNVGILEGLTSNVFVVHQDGTLYTAPDHTVLGGYARQLVMESAIRLGMNVTSSQPISLADAASWTEVFVTSAIKLITPIESIIIPQHDNNSQSSASGFLWSQLACTTNQRVWRTIYNDILSHQLNSK
jgi:hypothetical protein